MRGETDGWMDADFAIARHEIRGPEMAMRMKSWNFGFQWVTGRRDPVLLVGWWVGGYADGVDTSFVRKNGE